MHWALFLLAIAAVSAGLAFGPRAPKSAWIAIVCVIAAVECVLIGKPSGWRVQHVAALWGFAIVLPWAIVAACIFAFGYPQRARAIAIVAPVLYMVVLAVGLFFGDATGLIPQ